MAMSMVELSEQLNALIQLEKTTPDFIKQLDSEFWMTTALKDLYEMSIDYSQTEIPDFSNADLVPARRIISATTGVPATLLSIHKVDCTWFGTLFLATDGYFVSPKLMTELFNRCINQVRIPTKSELVKFNLPAINPLGSANTGNIRYETIRILGGHGCGFALADTEFNEVFDTWNQWEFLEL